MVFVHGFHVMWNDGYDLLWIKIQIIFSSKYSLFRYCLTMRAA